MAHMDGVTPAGYDLLRQTMLTPKAVARGPELAPRRIVSLSCGQECVALADDGTAWHLDWDAREWRALPELPKRVRGSV